MAGWEQTVDPRPLRRAQEEHNERVLRQARSEWVQGHILALPFSDKYIGESRGAYGLPWASPAAVGFWR